ncbi:MAG: hypothetical protein ACTS73_05165 [Arsenophonus sp. NEOnobi-MAG3]
MVKNIWSLCSTISRLKQQWVERVHRECCLADLRDTYLRLFIGRWHIYNLSGKMIPLLADPLSASLTHRRKEFVVLENSYRELEANLVELINALLARVA